MSQLKYAIQQFDEKKMAKARLNNAPLSRKIAIEIFNLIRYKSTKKARMLLEEVLSMKRAVPYKKFNRAVAHRTDIGPGRYPLKAVEEVLSLIKLAEANASNKGLSDNLSIKHLAANKGSTQWHHGRQSRRQVKATHLEIAVCEYENKNKQTKQPVEKQTKTSVEKKEVKVEKEEIEIPKEHVHQKYESKNKESAESIEKEIKSEKPKKTQTKKSESKSKQSKEAKE